MKVVSIENAKKPDENIVRILRNLLADAESGYLIGFGCVHAHDDGTSGLSYVSNRPVILLGELRILEREIVDSAIELTKHKAGEPY